MANIPTNPLATNSKNTSKDLNKISLVLATKQSGYYSSLEYGSGATIFPEDNGGNPAKCKYFEIGALPAAAGTSTTAHDLVFTRTVRIYGTVDDATSGISLPLPYPSSTAADIVELYIDNTNIYIIVGKDMSSYDARVYIEFIE